MIQEILFQLLIAHHWMKRKGDVTRPLNEPEVKIDSIKETDDKNRQIQKFLSEINELKSLFTNSLRDIRHDFLNGQIEIFFRFDAFSM